MLLKIRYLVEQESSKLPLLAKEWWIISVYLAWHYLNLSISLRMPLSETTLWAVCYLHRNSCTSNGCWCINNWRRSRDVNTWFIQQCSYFNDVHLWVKGYRICSRYCLLLPNCLKNVFLSSNLTAVNDVTVL